MSLDTWLLIAFTAIFIPWVVRLIWREEMYSRGKLTRKEDPLPSPPEF